MLNDSLLNFYGWAAYLSAVATIVTFITGILFFYLGERFGKINDLSSIFQVLFMLPLALMFVQLMPAKHLLLGVLAALIGIGGMVVSAYGQSLLVLERIDFQQSLRFFPAGGAIGIWLVIISSTSIVDELLPQPLAWIGVLAGLGYILTVVGFLRGGQRNMLFSLGSLVLVISYPIWATWLGRLLLDWGLG